MANSIDVTRVVIARLNGLGLKSSFPALTGDGRPNPKYATVCGEFDIALAEFLPDTLVAAMDEFVRTWKVRWWPMPGHIRGLAIEAQREATPDLRAPRLTGPTTNTVPRRWSEAECFRHPLGQEALRRGHGDSFFMWSKDNPGVSLQDYDYDHWTASSKRRREVTLPRLRAELADCGKDTLGAALKAACIRLGEAFDIREARLREEFLR